MSNNVGNAFGIVTPILGLAVAGYAVKTIGDMYHASCKSCGHEVKTKSYVQLRHKTEQHKKTMHTQSKSIFWD